MIPKKDKNCLNVGILGCGTISQIGHFIACQKGRNVVLHSICDIAHDLLDRMSQIYHPKKTFTDFSEMVKDSEIDLIIIATADVFHIPLALQAAKAGKHILVEKPLGIAVDSTKELVATVKKHGVYLQVGHMKRFDPGIQYGKQFIQKNIGEIVAFNGWYCDASTRYDATDSVHPVTYKSSLAKLPPTPPKTDLKEYYLLAHGSHLIDTALYLVGKIEAVQVNFVEKAGIYSWFIQTFFENNSNGHLNLTVAIKGDWHEGFEVFGTKGSIFGKTYNPWYHKPSEVRCFRDNDQTYHQLLDNKANTYQLQLEHFAEVILNKKTQIGTTVEEGLEIIKIMEAIRRSTKTGEKIFTRDIA